MSIDTAAAGVARLWLGLREPVPRAAYLATGLGLGGVKYAAEAAVVHVTTGRTMTPWAFLSPLYQERLRLLEAAPTWVGPAFYVWTLPFLWVALSMSIRRAANAGLPPWLGMLVLVPFLNLVTMAWLSVAPPRLREPHGSGESLSRSPAALDLLAVLFGPAYTLLMVGTSIYALNSYGAVLFFLTPVLIGAVSAYLSAVGRPGGGGHAILIALASLAASGATLLLLALEGAICLVMAAPLVLAAGMVGAAAGLLVARVGGNPWPHRDTFAGLLLLPLLAVAESRLDEAQLRSVTTDVTVDAPPAVVWNHVIGFPDLMERPEWYFRVGIACPTGATIEGHGVGAVRRCRFTTGDFVEPVTAWEEPRRLAFDVASQPHPMAEVNPFGAPHPPHLETALVSERGEFRLEPLPGGRTRLIGTTWYRLHMTPRFYWAAWTDGIIHRIHARVLRHVKRLAETEADPRDRP